MAPWKLDVANTFTPGERNYSLPNKLLVTAGPTNCSPRVISALTQYSTTPVCKEMYQMMDDMREMLKYVFQTKNELTLALQNSGTGGLEAALANLVDPGEKIIIASGGIWGDRTVEKAKIRNIDVVKLECKPGEVYDFAELEKEIIKHKPVMLFMTHGESSGGTNQPLEGLGDICHKYNCLLAVDAIVSLGGVPYFQDRWGIDVGVSATQKAIGAPPGLAFITLSPRAVQRMKTIKTRPPFVYNLWELAKVWNCFGEPRKYHYTYNSHMICAAREALAEIVDEGLENRWERHKNTAEAFWKGIEKLKMRCFVPNPELRLWTVNMLVLPSDIKWPVLLDYLENKYNVVIGFGIGPTTNKALRVGMMGYNARPEVVNYILKVLEDGIRYCRSSEGQLNSTAPKEVV
ncbi:hypothetical protein ILUMI_26336 [Ignelater luminosus]|uniref:Alanine--glyoxylate aminotransferase n=1 Tax=Ignelater luminosus TaxID=2038154 RepID=A0A8K0FZ69_IGNLU|nr:hypothetical protein ILUMI_26336 [Ignelater luminosus]